MRILDCLEKELFNELINFSFSEVRAVFNSYPYFIPEEQESQFVLEASQLKNDYEKKLDNIEKYSIDEYTEKINLGVYVPEYEEPLFKIKEVELQTKRKLIQIITKYFNRDIFQSYKTQLYGLESFKEETVETPYELLVNLNVNKSRIYSLLSIIGYYQRKYGFFMSRSDFLEICYQYSNEVYFINKKLGMEYSFRNIFISNGRIKPSKKKKSEEGVDINIQNFISEKFQSNKFIDIDKISLLELIQPYLKHNTKEIDKIIQIMMKNFNWNGGSESWKKTLEEVDDFIINCCNKGIMKRL